MADRIVVLTEEEWFDVCDEIRHIEPDEGTELAAALAKLTAASADPEDHEDEIIVGDGVTQVDLLRHHVARLEAALRDNIEAWARERGTDPRDHVHAELARIPTQPSSPSGD